MASGRVAPVATAGGALADAILALSPVGYWKLDEASGTQAADSSGNARHGTYQGTAFPGYAPYGGFPAFPNRATAYISVPDADAFSLATTPGLTVFALAYSIASGSGKYITKKGDASGNYEYGFLTSNMKPITSVWNRAGNAINARLASDALVTLNIWHGVAATIAGDTGSAGSGIDLYVNSGTVVTSTGTGAGGTSVNGSAALRIGEQWSGSLAHVAIFPGVLTATQIGDLMAAARADGLIP